MDTDLEAFYLELETRTAIRDRSRARVELIRYRNQHRHELREERLKQSVVAQYERQRNVWQHEENPEERKMAFDYAMSLRIAWIYQDDLTDNGNQKLPR